MSTDPLDEVQELMQVARDAGVPVPRYEAVVDVGELGTAVIQERAPGRTPSVVGDDLVHFDYTLGNVLVDADRPGAVTAVLDWDGARAGSLALDLAILAFDLTWRSPGALQKRVEDHLISTTDPDLVRRVQAHQALRMVDWSIRHYGPDELGHWLGVAEVRLYG